MKPAHIIIIIIFVISGIFYYNLTGNMPTEKKEIFVVRVIDGDTLESASGEKLRLLGVNTPEKGIFLHDEAENFLRERVENKTIEFESYGVDKYGRILAHIFLGEKHINEEILKNGLGSLYYYEKDRYYKKLNQVEELARTNKIGIWKDSSDKNCLFLVKLKYIEETKRCSNEEVIKIQNSCGKEISFVLKDDATHIYKEKIKPNSVFLKNFSCIWNDEGDSVFIWGDDGLILFWRYNS
ncbi:MAG: thermonuclease family protein [Nanoarchaeota archaeon]|nr:thermonuclease family protein [Nanoarchaeota archaeon]